MSAFYDLASLVVVPSGYKASKVYAQKPLTTDGQLAFTRSTTATRVNSAGLIESVAINVPRLDYLNSTCPKLLLEPSRTNIALHSSAFDNAAWSKYQATITANGATSPDGSVNADKLLDSTANDSHNLYAGYTIPGDTTFSIFVKSAEYTRFAAENLSDGGNVIFNLSTATVVSTSANYKNAKIENYGNGWYRLAATTNGVSGGKAMGWALVNNAGATTFAGTGTSGVFVYGVQVEVGSYSTSLIPTTTASVTRGADTYQKGGFGNTSTAGTLYYEFEATKIDSPNGQYLIQLFAGSSVGGAFFVDANAITITGNGPQIQGYNNSYSQLLFSSSPAIGATVKVALRYNGTNVVAFVNGVKQTVFADTAVGVKNAIRVNNGENGTQATRQILFFPTALSDAQCIELTA